MTTPFLSPGDKTSLEEGTEFTPKFDENGLIPCITQDVETGEVVMFAFMNAESLKKTLETGEAWYWSRSRTSLWHKGDTSGSVQTVIEMRTDCDQDVILIKVTTAGDGSNCHRGVKSCFYRKVDPDAQKPERSQLTPADGDTDA
ncbi:MAG: phosphoribosyl-AMP cyclohydrolase [Pseudomonadota bacterium]